MSKFFRSCTKRNPRTDILGDNPLTRLRLLWHGPHFPDIIAKDTKMPKPEWGVKRTCPSCAARYYDMMNDPVICPSCSAPFAASNDPKSISTAAEAAKAAAAKAEEELVDDDDDGTDVSSDDEILDDDEDDDGDESASPSLSDEDDDDDSPVKFDDDVLLDDEDDDDAIDDLGDVKSGSEDDT